jgi:hypothetical protein
VATKGNLIMMRLYDYYCYNKLYTLSQLDLIFSLQMYEKYKEIAAKDVRKSALK